MKHVLLVEDVEDNRVLARILLESSDWQVTEAITGVEALKVLEHTVPDVVLMDLSLPDMDGWEALTHIQKNPALIGVPVVAVTAHAMSGDRERVIAAGFCGYISKPINGATFVEEIEALMAQSARNVAHPSV
jgi:two-component system, cell cycle response regulator DivK